MFYAPNYFVGKGPMGRIWLAAHWDKKLTKAIIEKEDIIISIDQVFHNKDLPPLALRLSGHLLVGITRIYSRKVKYLLNDCSDALQKIKTVSISSYSPHSSSFSSFSTSTSETFCLFINITYFLHIRMWTLVLENA
jgi:hypothetical protein